MPRTGLLLLLAYLPVHGGTCENLVKLQLPHTTVERAETVAAGAWTAPSGLFQNTWAGSNEVQPGDLPAFCRVSLKISPVPDSEIAVEVWLPVRGWTSRFIAVGNGGAAGQINWRAMSRPLSRGYAVASTDTGHQGTGSRDITYAEGRPEKVTDFAHRAVHEMAVAAKLVVKTFYGATPRYSYWNGSSTGGRQGLKAAQMYPGDFEGIVSGAPVIAMTPMSVSQAYRAPLAVAAGATPLSPEKLKILHAAAVAQCDADDGVKDGVIGNPPACRFDPASASALTASELAMVRAFYEPLRHPVTKAEIYPEYAPGSELGWNFDGRLLEQPPSGLMIMNQPGFDKPFSLATDVERMDKADGGRISASTTDMRAFFKRGGKLMIVHGWSDPQISPLGSVQYYRRVLEDLGDVRSNFLLYMVPGMAHSRGGEGVNDFDSLMVMEQWVERGRAPAQILGRRVVEGKMVYTRPLCPWPQVAKYNGSGDPNHAASFACLSPTSQAQGSAARGPGLQK
jgi:feruloyl esterase